MFLIEDYGNNQISSLGVEDFANCIDSFLFFKLDTSTEGLGRGMSLYHSRLSLGRACIERAGLDLGMCPRCLNEVWESGFP